jgi:uncharacterized protein YndB with AHSA1/START domain
MAARADARALTLGLSPTDPKTSGASSQARQNGAPRKTLTVETDIAQRRETVFDILVDLRNYGAWLSPSIVFKGTSSISEGPIRVGTSYIETSVWGTRRGTVTELSRPERVAYWQPMTLNPAALGLIDVRVVDSLVGIGTNTHLTRRLDLKFVGPVNHIAWLVAHAFRTEIERLQARLKAYAETLPCTVPEAR